MRWAVCTSIVPYHEVPDRPDRRRSGPTRKHRSLQSGPAGPLTTGPAPKVSRWPSVEERGGGSGGGDEFWDYDISHLTSKQVIAWWCFPSCSFSWLEKVQWRGWRWSARHRYPARSPRRAHPWALPAPPPPPGSSVCGTVPQGASSAPSKRVKSTLSAEKGRRGPYMLRQSPPAASTSGGWGGRTMASGCVYWTISLSLIRWGEQCF